MGDGSWLEGGDELGQGQWRLQKGQGLAVRRKRSKSRRHRKFGKYKAVLISERGL